MTSNSGTTFSRRALLAGAAVAPATLPSFAGESALPGNAKSESDLLTLWENYTVCLERYQRIESRLTVARAAFEKAASPLPLGVGWGDFLGGELWKAHGLDMLHRDLDAAWGTLDRIIASIRSTPAAGPLGIGIKLAAMPADIVDECELLGAIRSVQRDVVRLASVESVLAARLTAESA